MALKLQNNNPTYFPKENCFFVSTCLNSYFNDSKILKALILTVGPGVVYSRIVMSCHFSPSWHSQKIPGWGWLAEAGVPVPPEAQEGCEKEEKVGQTALHHHKV